MVGISGTGEKRVQTVQWIHHDVLWPWPASPHPAPSWARSGVPTLLGMCQTPLCISLPIHSLLPGRPRPPVRNIHSSGPD